MDDHFVELLKILSNDDDNQNIQDEITNLTSLSAQNDPEAQYLLGIKYYKGEDVEQDMERAINFWEASLSNGREATRATLHDCIEDLTQKVNEASHSQDYETVSFLQRLIARCDSLLNSTQTKSD